MEIPNQSLNGESEREQSNSVKCILELPVCIFRRILYFVFVKGESSKQSMLYDTKSALNLLYTCKTFYDGYMHVVYSLKPLVVKSSNQGSFVSHKSIAYQKQGQESFFRRESIRKNVKMLALERKEGFRIKSLIKKYTGSNISYEMKNSIDPVLTAGLPYFQNLSHLQLRGNSPKALLPLLYLPDAVTSITVMIDYSDFYFFSETDTLYFINKLREKEINCKVSNFVIKSNKPVISCKKHPQVYKYCLQKLNLSIPRTPPSESSKAKASETNQKLNLGIILSEALLRFKDSVEFLALDQIDASVVFPNMKINVGTPRYPKFPRLKLIIFDSISKGNINAWFAGFKDSNSNLRDKNPLFFVMYDSMEGSLHTTTAAKTDKTHDERVYFNQWPVLYNAEQAIQQIKKNLRISY